MKHPWLAALAGVVILKVLHSFLKKRDDDDDYKRRQREEHNYHQPTQSSSSYHQPTQSSSSYHQPTQSSSSYHQPTQSSSSYHQPTQSSSSYHQPTQSSSSYHQPTQSSSSYHQPTQSSSSYHQQPAHTLHTRPSTSTKPSARPVPATRHSLPNPPQTNHSVANTQVAKSNTKLTPSISCNVQTPQQSTTVQHPSQLPSTSTTHAKRKRTRKRRSKKKNVCKTSETLPSLVNNVLLSHIPSSWGPANGNELQLVEITLGSEYNKVKSALKSEVFIQRIVRIQNPYLWGCYLLKKEECQQRNPKVKEMELWHMTSSKSANSIAKDNFDWRRAIRCKFGDGVSFSPDSRYASRQSSFSGVHILCKVLVGKELPVGGGNTWANIQIPPKGVDTTTGNSRKVYVKYCDHEYYPAYIVYYDNTAEDTETDEDDVSTDEFGCGYSH